MSCLFCRHWKSPKRDWREREKDPRPWAQQIKEDIGQCTFMPEWQETAADHYCGQMALTDNSLVWRLRDVDGDADRAKDSAELKRLTKLAKELRRQVRELKGGK